MDVRMRMKLDGRSYEVWSHPSHETSVLAIWDDSGSERPSASFRVEDDRALIGEGPLKTIADGYARFRKELRLRREGLEQAAREAGRDVPGARVRAVEALASCAAAWAGDDAGCPLSHLLDYKPVPRPQRVLLVHNELPRLVVAVTGEFREIIKEGDARKTPSRSPEEVAHALVGGGGLASLFGTTFGELKATWNAPEPELLAEALETLENAAAAVGAR